MHFLGIATGLLRNKALVVGLTAALAAVASGCPGAVSPPPPDTTAPSISGVAAGSVTATGAAISWTTDEASDSQVDYGTTTNYGQSSAVNSSMLNSHSVSLSGLTASTLYHYRVKSRDAAGNLGTSSDFTFTTTATPDATSPTVSMTAPANNATVSGNVTVSANASDNIGVAGVQFLLDGASLGAEDISASYSIVWDSTGATNGAHALAARARDAAGNQTTSTSVNVTVSNTVALQLELAPAVTGFTNPLDMQAPSDNSGRLFVAEQGGKIKIIQSNGTVSATAFIDVATRLGFTSGGETGLLGLAFHPNYAANGRFFVNYTSNSGGQLHTVIAEFTASPASSNTANPATERILFTVNQPFSNHNGGGLAFGNDGFLYIALGDGGSGGDPQCNGQNLNTLLGKISRIDVNTPPQGQQYVIPGSNPFFGQANRRGEIWLYGLRNPFRLSFDKANGTDLYIGDVGQDAFEEVDLLTPQQSGANLGWNLREGKQAFPSSTCTQVPGSTFTDPIFDYSHANGDNSITGGYVYRGANIPGLVGAYVFGDFISGRVWTLTKNAQGQWVRSANPVLNMGGGNLSSFGQAQNGDLHVVRYSSGEVARIRQVGTP